MENIDFSDVEPLYGIAPLIYTGQGAFTFNPNYIKALSDKAYNDPSSLTQRQRDLIKALADRDE